MTVKSTFDLDTTIERDSKHITDLILGITEGNKLLHLPLNDLGNILIAGVVGSGKSVVLNEFIISMMLKTTPNDIKFAIYDPNQIDYRHFNDSPFLQTETMNDNTSFIKHIENLNRINQRRYEILKQNNVSNIDEYNNLATTNKEDSLPYIITIVDELSPLITDSNFRKYLGRLLRDGKNKGLLFILSTQSIRANVITGNIKNNIHTSIAMRINSTIESRIILEEEYPELKEFKNGKMLIKHNDETQVLNGIYTHREDINAICDFLKEKYK